MADRIDARLLVVLTLVGGVAAVAVAMLAGVVPALLDLVAGPPAILRAMLAGGAIVLGGRLLLSALRRIDASMRRQVGTASGISETDLGAVVRGVRLVFLSAASFAAAAGWILGHPLPLVIALVIAGVDVVETSFLLLVASSRSRD